MYIVYNEIQIIEIFRCSNFCKVFFSSLSILYASVHGIFEYFSFVVNTVKRDRSNLQLLLRIYFKKHQKMKSYGQLYFSSEFPAIIEIR